MRTDPETDAAKRITRDCFLMLGTFAITAVAPAMLFPWLWAAVAAANAMLLHSMYRHARQLLRMNSQVIHEPRPHGDSGVIRRLYGHSEAS